MLSATAIEDFLNQMRAEGRVPLAQWPSDAPWSPAEFGLRIEGGQLAWIVEPDLMHAATLREALPWLRVRLFECIDSTNSQLVDEGARHSVAATLYLAEFQYGGRGRRGRSWLSPYGRNVSMSLALATRKTLTELGGLSIVAGLALADALAGLGLQNVSLKWPNDVMVEGKKLCGVLVELLQRAGSVEFVVGVGVNVSLTEAEEVQIGQPVADLRRCGVTVSRTDLIVQLVTKLHAYLEHFEREGLAPFVSAFNDLHLFQGQTCSIIQGDRTTSGVVSGIGDQGELILLTDRGERRFHGGEVSLRPESG